MRNIKSYAKDSFSFHEEVINRKNNKKNDLDYKSRLNRLNTNIKTNFDEYKERFESNTLEELIATGYNGTNQKDLQSLYSYRSRLLQKLKVELTTDDNNRINNTCQNCTIGEINSFDHYLPQLEFSEYIVNPLNLIPSCTKCNSYKGSIWRVEGKRIFLNLYIDELPDVQYLYANISVTGHDIDVSYYLDPTNINDNEQFELLKYHYNKLNLFNRFKYNSDTIISELDTVFLVYSKKLSIDEIKETIIEECQESYKLYGLNYWKLVLKLALISDLEYIYRIKRILSLTNKTTND